MNEPAPAAQAGQASDQSTPAAQEWYAGLPSEDIGYIQNKGWSDSPAKAVYAYKELEKFRGLPETQLLKLPKDLGDKEAMRAVYARLGMPEKPEDYKYDTIEGLDTARADFFKGVAHELGFAPEQYKALVEKAFEYESAALQKSQEEMAAQQQAEEVALRKEWGNAFDERAELGRRAVRTFLPKENQQEILAKLESTLGTSFILKLFSNIGESMQEDKIVKAEGRPFGQTPHQARAHIEALKNELKSDRKRLDNFNKGIGPDYQKMQQLIQQSVA